MQSERTAFTAVGLIFGFSLVTLLFLDPVDLQIPYLASTVLSFAVATGIVVYMECPMLFGPGFRTTICHTEPLKVFSVPGIGETNPLQKWGIFACHGTDWIPRSGGGRFHGYALTPISQIRKMPGCSVNINILGKPEIYRGRWDPLKHGDHLVNASGEKPLNALDPKMLEALQGMKGWRERAPVYVFWPGRWVRHFEENEQEVEVDYKEAWEQANVMNSNLEAQITKLQSRITSQSDVDRHVRETYGAARDTDMLGREKRRRDDDY